MPAKTLQPGVLDNSAIILVGPRYPENIGAAARIAFNFSIPQLIVVSDQEYDKERMLKMATHKAAHLIHDMEIHRETRSAVAPFNFLVGTTARLGKNRITEKTPRTVMEEIAPLLPSNKIGILFGPENAGLTNEDLFYCQYTSTIPTADFSSLNLAQAVGIHCYELFTAARAAATQSAPKSDLANSFEVEGMFDHIEQVLAETTFLKESNHSYLLRDIRHFLGHQKNKVTPMNNEENTKEYINE